MTPTDYSKQDLLDELEGRLARLLQVMNLLIDAGAAQRLRSASGALPATIRETLGALYDYAHLGHWDACGGIMDLDRCVEEAAVFLALCPALEAPGDDPDAQLCAHTIRKAQARHRLDRGQSLSLADVGLLGGLAEKTARNAAAMNGPERLRTCRQGARTRVRAADARVWLEQRKGYVPSRYVDSVDQISPLRFSSGEEVAAFVRGRRQEMGVSRERLLDRLGWQAARLEELAAIEEGQAALSPALGIQLARALGVNEFWMGARLAALSRRPGGTRAGA